MHTMLQYFVAHLPKTQKMSCAEKVAQVALKGAQLYYEKVMHINCRAASLARKFALI